MAINPLKNALTTHFVKQGVSSKNRILDPGTFDPTHRIQTAMATNLKFGAKIKKGKKPKSAVKSFPLPTATV